MDERDEKQLQSVRKQMTQLKAREKTILARSREKERKLRTRRLIQNGALAEKYLRCENLSPMQFEEELKIVVKKIEIANSVSDETLPTADEIMEKIENDFGYSEDEVVPKVESDFGEEPRHEVTEE